jgi:hypothetical protein
MKPTTKHPKPNTATIERKTFMIYLAITLSPAIFSQPFDQRQKLGPVGYAIAVQPSLRNNPGLLVTGATAILQFI